MYLSLIFLELFTFFFLILFGRFLGVFGTRFLSISSILISCSLSFVLFYEVLICSSVCYIKLFSWISFGVLDCHWGFFFDNLTVMMLLVVNVVSFMTQIYSIEYMKDESHMVRFMSYLALFTFFMSFLVTSANLLQVFVGWEGVGICSYLLINFWYSRISANKAALLAVFTNRIGDFALLLAFCVIFFSYHTFDLPLILSTSFLDLVDESESSFFFFFEYTYCDVCHEIVDLFS